MKRGLKGSRVGSAGGALVKVLVGCAAMAIGAFAVRQIQLSQQRPLPPAAAPLATPTPEPVVAVVATPTPAPPPPVVVATPTPAPVVVATPTPPPPALNLAAVAATPALWPRQVTLLLPKNFPLSMNGQLIGEAKVAAGTQVRLLRVAGQQVEVEYQNAKRMIPADSTDLMQRALAISKGGAGSHPGEPARIPVGSPTAPMQTSANISVSPPPLGTVPGNGKIGDRLAVDVIPSVKTKIEGGDYDDKTDHIKVKVRLTNKHTSLSADKFKGEVYVFGESILDRNAVKILDTASFDFSLRPSAVHEMATDEVTTRYDYTGARFGYKYLGWIVRVKDGSGESVISKSSLPELAKKMEKMTALTKGHTFDRTTLKDKTVAR